MSSVISDQNQVRILLRNNIHLLFLGSGLTVLLSKVTSHSAFFLATVLTLIPLGKNCHFFYIIS